MITHPAGITGQFAMSEITIYAYVSPSGEVVYVGRTVNPPVRDGRHRCDSPWYTPDLTFTLVDFVEGWTTAVHAEAEYIRQLQPTANIRNNRRAAA